MPENNEIVSLRHSRKENMSQILYSAKLTFKFKRPQTSEHFRTHKILFSSDLFEESTIEWAYTTKMIKGI